MHSPFACRSPSYKHKLNGLCTSMLEGVKFCLAPERQQHALPAGFVASWWMEVFLSQMYIWHLDGLCLGIDWWKTSESLSKCIPQSRKIRPEDYFECSIQSKEFLRGGVRGVKVELKDSCFKGQAGRIGSIGSLSSSQSSVCPAEDSAHKAAKVMLLYSEKSLWIKHWKRFNFTVLSLVRNPNAVSVHSLAFHRGFPKWKDWLGFCSVPKRECGFLSCSLISESNWDEITGAGQSVLSKERGWCFYSVPTQVIRLITGQCQHFDGTFWCCLSSVQAVIVQPWWHYRKKQTKAVSQDLLTLLLCFHLSLSF